MYAITYQWPISVKSSKSALRTLISDRSSAGGYDNISDSYSGLSIGGRSGMNKIMILITLQIS